jgi:hypothetical protein
MVLPLVGKLSLRSFGVGALAAAVASVVARPLLVGTVRAGYEISDGLQGVWAKAKAEADGLKADALAERNAASTQTEIQALREEVAALRAQVASKRSS